MSSIPDSPTSLRHSQLPDIERPSTPSRSEMLLRSALLKDDLRSTDSPTAGSPKSQRRHSHANIAPSPPMPRRTTSPSSPDSSSRSRSSSPSPSSRRRRPSPPNHHQQSSPLSPHEQILRARLERVLSCGGIVALGAGEETPREKKRASLPATASSTRFGWVLKEEDHTFPEHGYFNRARSTTTPQAAAPLTPPPTPPKSFPPLSLPHTPRTPNRKLPPLPSTPRSPTTTTLSSPTPRTPFNARTASAQCKLIEGYVSFAAIEGLGEPPTPTTEEDEEAEREREKGRGWLRWFRSPTTTTTEF